MAAATNRDVSLTVQASTIGEDSIREMADQVRALGKTGGDAAPQFEALAQELDRVADSQRAIQTLQDLDAAMTQTAQIVSEASETYDAAAAKVNEQASALAVLREAQAAANAAVNDAKAVQIAAAEAYALTRAEIQAHSERTDADRQSLSQAAAAQATATAQVRQATLAYRQLTPDVSAAAKSLDALQKSANFANRELTNVQQVAATQVAAYEAATAAAQGLGVETTALVDEQARLLDTQNEIVDSTQRLQASQAAAAETERLLAQQSVALSQAQIALERDMQAATEASIKARAAAEQDLVAKAEAADGYQLYLRAIEEVNAALLDQAQARSAAQALEAAAAAREAAAATLAEADAYGAFVEASKEVDAILLAEQQAQLALAEAKAEQAESDRLAIIQINAAFAARQNGIIALNAELAAINDVAAADALLAESQARTAAATAELAEQARAAGEALSSAFSNVGVRSLQEIQVEVAGVEQSMAVLRANFEAGGISAQDMARAIGAATLQLEGLRDEAASIPQIDGVFKQLSATISGIITDFGALGAAVATIGFAFKPLLDANIQLETTRRTLTQVLGSVSAANDEIDKLAASANRVGVAVGGLDTSFSQFAAAAKTAGLSTAQVEQVFNSTVGAAGALGLSGQKVTLILEALGQMASKGVVSMEELRRQLGNSLPGALALMANSLGITTAQLDKLVSTGQLLASDALPALAAAMAKIGDQSKPVEGLQQSFARLGNSVTQLYQQFSQTTAYSVLNAAVSGLAKNLGTVVTVVTSLGELWAAKSILSYLDGVNRLNAGLASTTTTTAAVTVATEANAAAEAESTAAVATNTAARAANVVEIEAQVAALVAQNAAVNIGSTGVRTSATVIQQATGVASVAFGGLRSAVSGAFSLLGGIPGVALLVLANAKAIGTAIGETAASWTAWGAELKKNEALLDAQSAKEKEAYDASQQLRASIVQLTAQYNDLTAPLAKATEAAQKHSDAQKLEGEASKELAALNGQQNVIIEANAKAANLQAQASQAVADKTKAQAEATQDLVSKIELQVASGLKLNDAEQKKLLTFQQTLLVEQASADKAQAQADADNIAATAAFNHAVALKDQSGALQQLQLDVANATNRIQALQTAQALGVDVGKQLTKATSDQAQAQALLTKAYQDTVDNAARAAAATKDAISVQTAQTNATIAFYQADKQAALAIGDTQRARQDDIAIQREQVDLLEQQIAAIQAQTKADQAQLAVMQAKISPADANYRQELADIAALKAKIAVEQQETQSLDSNIDGINSQSDALQRNTTSIEQNAAAAAKAAADKAAAAGVSDTGLTKNGGPNGTFDSTVPLDQIASIIQKSQSGTLTPADLAAAQAALTQATNANQFLHAANQQSSGSVDANTLQTIGAQMTLLQQIVANLAQQGTKDVSPVTGPGTATPVGTPASTSHTVTVNLNGQSTTINTASANDGAALSALVQQLSRAATRAQG